MKTRIAWIMWRVTYGVMAIASIFISVKVESQENDLENIQKPLILVSNHRGIMDPWFISFAFPFSILFGKIFPLRPYSSVKLSDKNILGRFFKSIGLLNFVYFVYDTIDLADKQTFEEKITPLVEALNHGQSIMLFPEGRLVSDDSILEFKKGVIRIHELTHAPILPVAIKYDRGVHVSIGSPISIPQPLLSSGNVDEYKKASEFVREKVVDLYQKMG